MDAAKIVCHNCLVRNLILHGATCGLVLVTRLTSAQSMPTVDNLPLLRDGIQSKQFCCYDHAGDNYDWEYFSH